MRKQRAIGLVPGGRPAVLRPLHEGRPSVVQRYHLRNFERFERPVLGLGQARASAHGRTIRAFRSSGLTADVSSE